MCSFLEFRFNLFYLYHRFNVFKYLRRPDIPAHFANIPGFVSFAPSTFQTQNITDVLAMKRVSALLFDTLQGKTFDPFSVSI